MSSSGAAVAGNDNRAAETAQELRAAFAQVGAFELPNGSKDAAVVATLPAGGYTAVVSSADGSSGVALVEVYELPH